MQIRILPFTLLRILPYNLILIRYPTSHLDLDLDPPVFQNDPLRLPPFHFDVGPDSAHFDAGLGPVFHFDADPASQNYVDPDPATLVCT